MVNEGLAVFCAVMGMDGQAGLLVHQEDVFILVNNVQPGRCHGEIGVVRPGAVKKFVVDV